MSNLREKKKKERKQRIFSAAVFLLNKKGFSNTSMQDIASRARLAVGTLYNYYTSKNDLIIDIFEQENQNYFVKLENLLADLENSDQTAEEMIITILLDFMEDFLFLDKQTMKEILAAFFSSDEYAEKGMRLDLQLIEGLVQFLQNLKKEGQLDPDLDCSLTAEIIYSILFEEIIMYCMIPALNKEKLKKRLTDKIKILFSGLTYR